MNTKNTLMVIFSALISFSAHAGSESSKYQIQIPASVSIASNPPGGSPEASDPDYAVDIRQDVLPAAFVGQPYVADLNAYISLSGGDGSYNLSEIQWSLKSESDLPAGLIFDADGSISGIPTTVSAGKITAVAYYKTASGEQQFNLPVDEISTSLTIFPGYSSNFGQIFVNNSSTQRFQYKNTGTVDIDDISAEVVGSAYATVSATTCAEVLAPNASCAFDVTYHPVASDVLIAQLNVRNSKQVNVSSISLSGQASNLLYSGGWPGTPVFIKTLTGTSGTYLGAQTSTTQLPSISEAYLGGSSINIATPVKAQQIYLMSTTSNTATYLMGIRDTYGPGPWYTKMVRVVITLNGNQAYATLSGARYNSSALITGEATNILALWNAGTTTTSSTGGVGYGVAGITVMGF